MRSKGAEAALRFPPAAATRRPPPAGARSPARRTLTAARGRCSFPAALRLSGAAILSERTAKSGSGAGDRTGRDAPGECPRQRRDRSGGGARRWAGFPATPDGGSRRFGRLDRALRVERGLCLSDVALPRGGAGDAEAGAAAAAAPGARRAGRSRPGGVAMGTGAAGPGRAGAAPTEPTLSRAPDRTFSAAPCKCG